MNRAKYLLVVLAITFTYVLLSLTVGRNSIKCYKNLEEQKQKISLRTSEIQKINNDLTLEYSALLNDTDVIAAYARKLDYVANDEKLVKINGLKVYQNTLYDTGKVLKHYSTVFLSEKSCKIISLAFGFMTFVILILYDISKGNISFGKKKTVQITGIPVYDVKQI